MSVYVYADNVLREFWDDAARTYTAWDAAGVVVAGTPRPFTAAENVAGDSRVAQVSATSNQKSILQLLNDTLPTLDTITNTTNANMSGNTAAAAIKDEARALRRIIRILTNNLSATN